MEIFKFSIFTYVSYLGHKSSVEPIETDDSWMDEVEPTAAKTEKKKSKKNKDKTKKEKV
jgi:hypothetical protein